MSANRNDRGSISTFYSLCLLLLCYSATCTKGETVFSIRDQSGSEVASFDDQGNLYLNGGLTTNTTPQSTGGAHFWIQGVAIISMSTGDMTISGSLYENQTNMTGANNFVVKDNSSNPVAYIDTSGNLFLKGTSNIYMGDIDVDSNRSGAIEGTPEEDDLEETQRAIVPVNCDDDGGYPDKDCLNNCIDNGSDLDDLIPLIIRKVPAGWTATLSIENGDASKIRVFNGDDYWQQGDEYWYSGDPVPADHSWPILGRQEVSEQESTYVSSYQIPDLSNDLTYYMEGLEFRNSVSDNWTIKLTITNGSQTFYDRVKLRPSPFMLLPATCGAGTVYVADHYSSSDDPFVTNLKSSVSGVEDVYMGSIGNDVWFQDEFEIGYTSWPGGGMHVTWNLPRDRGLDNWVQGRLGPNMGYFEGGYGEGGDIEVVPFNPNGIVITGSVSSGIQNFIVAQGIQTIPGQSSIITCDTSWLAVGHIDEVVSFFGGSAAIADCDAALDILDNMNKSCTGTGSGGTTNTLTSTAVLQYGASPLNPQDWIGGFIKITSGAGLGQVRQISNVVHNDSTSTTITVTRNWYSGNPPGSGSGFELVARSAYRAMFAAGQEECGVATGGDSTHLYDSTKSWNGEYNRKWVQGNEGNYYWYYSYIMIVDGPAAGDINPIQSSQGNTITTYWQWSTAPTEESVYVIVDGTKNWAFSSGPPPEWYRWPDVQANDSSREDPMDDITAPAFTVVRYFLQQYRSDHETYQTDCLLPIETALSSYVSSFTRVPAIYRGSSGQAWLPAMVNLLNAGSNVIAEPHVSEQGSFNNEFKVLGGSYIDDWYFYHTGRGNVHCATNAKRDPGSLEFWW